MTRTAKRLLIVLVVFVVLLVGLDVLAKIAVEQISARELRDADQIDAGAVDTSVDSFPFLGRLLLSGETSFSIGLDDVTEQGVQVDRIEFDVDGLVFNRSDALERRVRIDRVDRVRATVIIEEDTITAAVGVPVDIEPGSATAGGATVELAVQDRLVQVGVPGIGSASVAIPSSSYVPCAPELVLAQDQVELSCIADMLPPLVNEALGRVTP